MVAERKPKKTPAPKREPTIAIAKMTSKGQITLPKAVRERFDFEPGDEVVFFEDDTGTRVRRATFKIKNLKKWQAYFKDLRGRSSDEIIDDWRGH